MRGLSWILGLMVLMVTWSFSSPAQAGKLEAVRSEVRNGSSGSSSRSSSSSSSSGSSSDTAAGAIGVLGDILGAIFEGASERSSGNRASYGPPPPPPKPLSHGRYERYPYHDGHKGHVLRIDDGAMPRGQLHAGRLSVEGAYMGDNVWRSAFDLDLSLWRFSLLSDMGFYLEQPLKDALYLGGTYLAFTAVMRPRFSWRLGFGANYMVDGRTPGEGHREYAAGYGGTTRIDVFPAKPLVLSARLDYGTLYRAPVFTGRATAGIMVSAFEIYAGYEVRTVGKVRMNGPLLGVRAWF